MSEPVVEHEKGYRSGGSDDSDSQEAVFERPKGFKGLYSHPVTQVSVVRLLFHWSGSSLVDGNARSGLLYVPGSFQRLERSRWWRTSRPQNKRQFQLGLVCDLCHLGLLCWVSIDRIVRPIMFLNVSTGLSTTGWVRV